MEAELHEAINPENISKHFAQLETLMTKNNIRNPTPLFNLDKFVFSMRGITLGRPKFILKWDERGNTRDVKFRGSCDHVTLMPFVSAPGQIMMPLAVLPVVETKHRKRQNGKYETASDFLPKPNYLHVQSVSGVDTNIFYS